MAFMPYFVGAGCSDVTLAALLGALDVVDIGIILLDRNMQACFVNQRCADMCLRTEELEADGRGFDTILRHLTANVMRDLPGSEAAASLEEFERAVRDGEVLQILVDLPDGRRLLLRCAPCPDGGRLLTCCDITPLKVDEEAREQARHEAESMSAEQRFIAETLEEQASHLVTLAESADENARRVERMNKLLQHEIAERRELAARLRRMATTDGLTGTLNRARFLALAQRALTRARRLGEGMAVLMLDIDHFKQINDCYGHQAGDAALKHFVDRLRAGIREHDLLGRLGGEEFAIALTTVDGARAFEVAERLRLMVAGSPVRHGGHTFDMSVSIGIATPRESDESIARMLARADARLYAAKQAGRNQVCAATD
jgi:diguanylate cyclase (GGDEF)-like protein